MKAHGFPTITLSSECIKKETHYFGHEECMTPCDIRLTFFSRESE